MSVHNSNPAPPTSIVKWSRWTRWTDENGIVWLRYSLRCTDPLPQELFDKIDFSQIELEGSFFTQVDESAAPPEDVLTFGYKSYGFIIREDALFGNRVLEGQVYPTLRA